MHLINRFLFKKKLSNYRRVARLFSKNRATPNCFLVGFQKCGTTSLYEYLHQIPSFEKGLYKEHDTFSFDYYFKENFELNFPFKNPLKKIKTIDASHQNTFSPFGLERIKKHYPQSKLIVIVRNPIDRAFSHFQMDIKLKLLNKNISFDRLVEFEISILANIEDVYDITELYKSTNLYGGRFGMPVSRGIYYPYVKKIIDLNLDYHLLTLEDLNSNFEGEMSKIVNFLEIELPKDFRFQVKRYNQGSYGEKMQEKAKIMLNEFYKTHNEKLFNLIGRNFNWD